MIDTLLDPKDALAKKVTLSYVVGLTIVATLALAAHLMLEGVISQQKDAAKLINIAGRQRMLSQRIGLLSSDVFRNHDAGAQPPLREAINLMRTSQEAIIHGGLGIHTSLSGPAKALYFEGHAPLEEEIHDFLKAAESIATMPSADVRHDPGSDVGMAFSVVEKMARSSLLPHLNEAVGLFESEATGRVQRLRTTQLVTLGILLVTLLLEAIFIYRPVVARLKRYAKNLYHLATRDMLTDLPNRRYFMDAAEREFMLARRSGKRLSALVLDLDHFKSINDTYGHAAGDQVLRRFAQIALQCLRKSDILGRIGGEEFALVVPEIDLHSVIAIAEKLRLSMACDETEGLPPFTVSIGISTFIPEDKTIHDLLARADKALYGAKESGRNRWAVYEM